MNTRLLNRSNETKSVLPEVLWRKGETDFRTMTHNMQLMEVFLPQFCFSNFVNFPLLTIQ